ncbi:ADP-ribosylation factor GTPase-activating protein gcs1 [Exophiala xenobiotica]|nr:ADP-ribosylation factor GTPase-activating protein gcs1 [Exophiala xenobiotica]KAK5252567.1 ADP-ribosylation factor GTPase-activating protein gcs1 [Exophiala xenobiotica]KAK5347465.1 ADP-ribosylation factor GTPase-activating protein gcs1 [Exophiala xenobiotica]KAK5359849.1 ADP-ribosylation factor GTPase-activating protein gcs1 [Exophiala xenobiotica]KAK5364041.1 ADP-ribosylation factor GTPase-activating protein gcs1 [Exophiala xenobiotica]
MASKAMWEVDPETRSKLAQISKKEGAGNDRCCDCGAPSPQWASPKFSTFICLQCAGTHRGLGVHVSFVRSVSMDAFKQAEILRMQYGGNKAWQNFFNKISPIPFDECTIKERYDCEIGEEWKERLTAQVEERDFDKAAFLKERQAIKEKQASRSATPAGGVRNNNNPGTNGPGSSRTASPAPGRAPPGISAEQKAQNEAYFAKMGDANASRPDSLPPSQGGKYAGFGSAPVATQQSSSSGGSIPSADEFSKDPVAALTKGFGWFSATVGKQAKLVHESYIQPTAKNLATSDFAAQARTAALTAGKGLQTGAKGAAESFNKFVEGQDAQASAAAAARGGEPERKDFWDSFGAAAGASGGASSKSNNSSIGTNAMKKTPGSSSQTKSKDDGWGDDW